MQRHAAHHISPIEVIEPAHHTRSTHGNTRWHYVVEHVRHSTHKKLHFYPVETHIDHAHDPRFRKGLAPIHEITEEEEKHFFKQGLDPLPETDKDDEQKFFSKGLDPIPEAKPPRRLFSKGLEPIPDVDETPAMNVLKKKGMTPIHEIRDEEIVGFETYDHDPKAIEALLSKTKTRVVRKKKR